METLLIILSVLLIVLLVLGLIYLLGRLIDPESFMSNERYAIKYLGREYTPINDKCGCGGDLNKLLITPSYTLEPCDHYVIKCDRCNYKDKLYL